MNLNNKFYTIGWGGGGFGDQLLAAYVANILNFNKIPCQLNAAVPIKNLINCKRFYPDFEAFGKPINIRLNRTKRKDPNFTIITDLLNYFIHKSKLDISLSSLNIKDAPHPIVYKALNNLKKYDVALVTKTGGWTPCRNWPYFSELKKIFKKNSISYIDLSAENIRGFEFLNYVKKCNVYLGLETGSSHYAAPFISGKGFIIQSGYCDFRYWAAHYDYEFLHYPVNCSPCWKRRDCDKDHKCMTQISPDRVFEIIQDDL